MRRPIRRFSTIPELITRRIDVPQANSTSSAWLYVGDMDDLTETECLFDISANYNFEYSWDGVHAFTPVIAPTTHDTETAIWVVGDYGTIFSGTAGKATLLVWRANYVRITTSTYVGGSGFVLYQGLPI